MSEGGGGSVSVVSGMMMIVMMRMSVMMKVSGRVSGRVIGQGQCWWQPDGYHCVGHAQHWRVL